MGAQGVQVGELNASQKVIYPGGAAKGIWSASGKTLFFLGGSSLYAAYAPDFSPVELQTPFYLSADQPVWMMP